MSAMRSILWLAGALLLTVAAPARAGDAAACCFLDGTCAFLTEEECELFGGVSWHEDLECEEVVCDVYGACCFSDCRPCEELPADECVASGGTFQGEESRCDTVSCPDFGACCLSDGSCVRNLEWQCESLDGVSWEACASCEPGLCGVRGSCCFYDGTCIDGVYEEDCLADPDATAWTPFASCGDVTCPVYGSCCLEDGDCQEVTMDDCLADGGLAWYPTLHCDETYCPFIQEASFEFPLSPGDDYHDFVQFDEMNGIRELEEVQLRVEAEIGANVYVENLSPDMPAQGLTARLLGSLDTQMEVFFDRLAADESVEAPTIAPGGSYEFGRISVASIRQLSTSDPDELETFLGQLWTRATVVAEGQLIVTSPVPFRLDITQFEASGRLRVTYIYSLPALDPTTMGACCLADGRCVGPIPEAQCAMLEGTYLGDGTVCDSGVCLGECPADLNGDGQVSVTDLVRVLGAWGSTGGPEDVDASGVVGQGDFTEVLNAWGACD
jgi:hypothetical protein